MSFSDGLNNVHSNVWGFIIICIGAGLSFTKHPDVGLTLISTGAVLLKQTTGNEAPPSIK